MDNHKIPASPCTTPGQSRFVNFSNHPGAVWSEEQRAAAAAYGEIVDVTFPNVSPQADEAEVAKLAQACADKILALKPTAVMCQGEMTLTFAVVALLQAAGVPALAACSEHISEEKVLPDGTTKKISGFKFCRFRRYEERV